MRAIEGGLFVMACSLAFGGPFTMETAKEDVGLFPFGDLKIKQLQKKPFFIDTYFQNYQVAH